MNTSMKTLLIALSALGLSATATAMPNSTTEATSSEAPAMQQQAPVAERPISEEALQQFTDAYKEVEEIRMDYADKAQKIDNPQEMSQLQMTMQAEMIEAVENTGIDIDTYNKLAQSIPYDADLRAKIEELL
ncbi:MAG TPA: DUF4168 domain-containing protein [Alcanivoracaceae bacterium]|nr:DUF4168 domain-containing protein [Alcanivoracaceae bacterium]